MLRSLIAPKITNYIISYLKKYGFCKKLCTTVQMNLCQLNTFFVLSSLLGGCNSKATRNPPKSDDRMKKIGQLVRVAFVQNPPMVEFIKILRKIVHLQFAYKLNK